MAANVSINLNEDIVPVPEELFSQLRQASPPDATQIAETLPEPQRARLAAFCYNKSHLHALGLMIAATCDRIELMKAAGRVGEVIYEQSRDPDKTLLADKAPRGSVFRKPISLAVSASVEPDAAVSSIEHQQANEQWADAEAPGDCIND